MPPILLSQRANVESPSVQREGSSNDHSSRQEERMVGSKVQSQMVPNDRVEAEIPTQEQPVVPEGLLVFLIPLRDLYLA